MTELARLASYLGIKQRLSVLVLITVAPLVLLLGWATAHERATAIATASTSAAQIARIAAERQSSAIDEAINVLDDMRAIPAITLEGGSACRDQLRLLVAGHPHFETLGVMRSDGVVVCHNILDTPSAVGHGPLFKPLLAPDAPETFVSRYRHGLVTGNDVIYVARPLRSATGEKVGVVFASVNLQGYAALAQSIAGKDHFVAVIEPATGIVLAQSGLKNVAVGSLFPSQQITEAMRTHPDGGSTEAALEGTEMIFGFAPLRGAETSGAMLAIGTPRAEVLAETNRQTRWTLDVAIAVVVAALCFAWWIAYASQVRPTERLAALARRLGKGDLSARHEIDVWQAPELRFLGETFNKMAARLEDASKEAKTSEARYRLLAENTGDFVTRADAQGLRTFVSPASRELLGYEPDELLGKSPLELAHPDDREQFAAMLQALLEGETAPAAQYRARRSDGTYVWVETQGRPVGPEAGFVLSVRDITRRKLAEDKLAEATHNLLLLATTDGLTGLNNRRSFDNALAQECARCARDRQPLALLLIDVDHFKSFNDTYGHQAGDECLKELSRQLARLARRPADFAARYGGEELAVILPNNTERNAVQFAERYRKLVASSGTAHTGSPIGVVTVSVGVACEIPGRDSGPDLLHRADEALYRAKAGGRNRVVSIGPEAAIRQPIRA